MPSKKYHVDLSISEQQTLSDIISSYSASSQIVKRAYVLLACDRKGEKVWKDAQIASTYHVRSKTVENIRERFVKEGFEQVLYGKKQTNFKEKIFTGEVEAHLIALRCSEPPEGRARWTLQLLADKMVELSYVPHMSDESVRQILKKTNLSLGKTNNG